MTNPATTMSISVERVMEMSEREIYDLADNYVKGRFYRFAVDPETRGILEQREMDAEDRDPRYDELFESYRAQLYSVLYDYRVLPRYRLALLQTARAVERQLDEFSDNRNWKRGAMGFLSLVKDEMARADVVLTQQEEESARHHLDVLLSSIAAHQEADDADEADKELYEVANRISDHLDSSTTTDEFSLSA